MHKAAWRPASPAPSRSPNRIATRRATLAPLNGFAIELVEEIAGRESPAPQAPGTA